MVPLGTYDSVSKFIGISKHTLYGYVSTSVLPPKIYLGRGRFNMELIEKHVRDNTLFQKESQSYNTSGKIDLNQIRDSITQRKGH
jgi:hypothetical protein